jgi:hypothetical protein
MKILEVHEYSVVTILDNDLEYISIEQCETALKLLDMDCFLINYIENKFIKINGLVNSGDITIFYTDNTATMINTFSSEDHVVVLVDFKDYVLKELFKL